MIVQVIVSFGLLLGIFTVAFHIDVKTLGLMANINALMIVIGGTIAASLLAYPVSRIVQAAQYVIRAFRSEDELGWTIKTLVGMAREARKKGLLALDKEEKSLHDELIKSGIGLISYQFDRENIEQTMRRETLLVYSRYETAYKIIYSMARVAPAMGLAGTVVNLIRMFSQITNPQHLIGFMAIALLSTLYGVILTNLCFMPLCNKLREFMDQDLLRMEIIEEGILDIYDQEHPRAMEFKLERIAGIRTELLPPVITAPQPQVRVAGLNG